jgi:ribonucleoside-diphosphate reductase beta chain
MDIFERNDDMFDFNYPHLSKYGEAILESFWTPEHFNYDRDLRDYKHELNDIEKEVVKRAVLCISNVENKVKGMWARIDMRLPHPEIANSGHILAMNEVVHQNSYKMILNLLNLKEDFNKLTEEEEIKDRIKYLSKYLEGVSSRSNKEFTKSLILFTLLIENVSLFSQFMIMSSFNKYKNVMSNFNAIVSASGKDEGVHGQFGAELINIIRKENPEWFDEDMKAKIYRSVDKAYEAEIKIIDWIFEQGELEFLSKEDVKNYLKHRFNYSLNLIGYEPLFEVPANLLEKTMFFDRATKSSISFDFFNQKSGDYNLKNLITDNDWN